MVTSECAMNLVN